MKGSEICGTYAGLIARANSIEEAHKLFLVDRSLVKRADDLFFFFKFFLLDASMVNSCMVRNIRNRTVPKPSLMFFCNIFYLLFLGVHSFHVCKVF